MNPLGHPVVLKVTGAEAADSPHLPDLIAGLPTQAVLADKGYDSNANREAIHAAGAVACIPLPQPGTDNVQRPPEVACVVYTNS